MSPQRLSLITIQTEQVWAGVRAGYVCLLWSPGGLCWVGMTPDHWPQVPLSLASLCLLFTQSWTQHTLPGLSSLSPGLHSTDGPEAHGARPGQARPAQAAAAQNVSLVGSQPVCPVPSYAGHRCSSNVRSSWQCSIISNLYYKDSTNANLKPLKKCLSSDSLNTECWVCLVLSPAIFCPACEQCIGRYAGPSRAGTGQRMRSWAHLDTRELGLECGWSWPESGNNKNHNNYVNIGHCLARELRLSLSGKMEKVKSAEVALDWHQSRLLPTNLVIWMTWSTEAVYSVDYATHLITQ